MIIFKVLLVILLAAPVVGLAGFLFAKARNYSASQNRVNKYNDMFAAKQSRYNDTFSNRR